MAFTSAFRFSPAACRYVRSTWNWLKIEKNLVWVWSGCGLQSLLKLKIFKNGVLEASGLDFGGPGPRFWRLRASILEAPGLDFRASRPTCSGKTLFPQVSCLKRFPPSFSSFPNCMAVLQHSCHQKGEAAVVPPGGFQSAAHRRCGNGVLN